MNAATRRRVDRSGPLAWMTKNTVAANILMWVCLIGGVFGFMNMTKEVFPEFELDLVTISVAYPGASPEDVEQGIVLAVEEAISGVEGIVEVNSTANEVRQTYWWKSMNRKMHRPFTTKSNRK